MTAAFVVGGVCGRREFFWRFGIWAQASMLRDLHRELEAMKTDRHFGATFSIYFVHYIRMILELEPKCICSFRKVEPLLLYPPWLLKSTFRSCQFRYLSTTPDLICLFLKRVAHEVNFNAVVASRVHVRANYK